MKKVRIAFDIDGTLRNNVESYGVGEIGDSFKWNKDICELAKILSKFKNVEVIIWSGGGKEYAKNVMEKYKNEISGGKRVFKGAYSKTEASMLDVDVAIDDIHYCDLGKINLIVREK